MSHPRMREQWRRYRFMVEQAPACSAKPPNPAQTRCEPFLNWLQNQMDEDARVTEMPVPEEDEEAVRVMTVHGAKGLEFPVVVLTGINSPSRHTIGPVLFDRDARRIEVGLGSQENRIATPGYERMAEREKLVQEAEEVRLMYVACTRARDHLVLSLRRTARGGKAAAAGKISEYLKDNPELWEPAPIEPPEAPPAADSPGIKASLDHSLEAPRPMDGASKETAERDGTALICCRNVPGPQRY